MSNLNDKPLTKLIDESKPRYLTGKERNKVRSLLRKALKASKLSIRTTYHDFYDSCHAPEVTPNAPWTLVKNDEFTNSMLARDFMAHSHAPALYEVEAGKVYELSTGSNTKQVRIEE